MSLNYSNTPSKKIYIYKKKKTRDEGEWNEIMYRECASAEMFFKRLKKREGISGTWDPIWGIFLILRNFLSVNVPVLIIMVLMSF